MKPQTDPFYYEGPTTRTHWLVRTGVDDDNADNGHVTAREAKALAANPTPDILSIEKVVNHWYYGEQGRTDYTSIYERDSA